MCAAFGAKLSLIAVKSQHVVVSTTRSLDLKVFRQIFASDDNVILTSILICVFAH